MELLIIGIVMGVVVALVANSKGRSGCAWFFYGVLIWPVALVHILVSTSTPESEMRRAKMQGRIPCPNCAELIKQDARICPYCRQDV